MPHRPCPLTPLTPDQWPWAGRRHYHYALEAAGRSQAGQADRVVHAISDAVAPRLAQIRAGYRADIVNSKRNVASPGLGLALFKVVHVDIAVAGNKNEAGASFQLGMRF